jgi:hypothetical protein
VLKRLIVLFVVLNLSACNSGGEDCNNSRFDGLRVNPPPSAEFSSESCRAGINASYRATFTMDTTDLETLQDSTPITEWETDASAASVYDEEAANMESLIVGYNIDGAYETEVLIDTTNPDLYTVYYARTNID